MKRTWMLYHIEDVLNTAPRSISQRELADIILKEMEEQGMLPPRYTKFVIEEDQWGTVEYNVSATGWEQE